MAAGAWIRHGFWTWTALRLSYSRHQDDNRAEGEVALSSAAGRRQPIALRCRAVRVGKPPHLWGLVYKLLSSTQLLPSAGSTVPALHVLFFPLEALRLACFCVQGTCGQCCFYPKGRTTAEQAPGVRPGPKQPRQPESQSLVSGRPVGRYWLRMAFPHTCLGDLKSTAYLKGFFSPNKVEGCCA
jgi:hypothetical protein